jgi:hypothetical protein
MANEKHLALIHQEIAIWNEWRIRNPGSLPDLSKAHLRQADLSRCCMASSGTTVPDARRLSSIGRCHRLVTNAFKQRSNFRILSLVVCVPSSVGRGALTSDIEKGSLSRRLSCLRRPSLRANRVIAVETLSPGRILLQGRPQPIDGPGRKDSRVGS